MFYFSVGWMDAVLFVVVFLSLDLVFYAVRAVLCAWLSWQSSTRIFLHRGRLSASYLCFSVFGGFCFQYSKRVISCSLNRNSKFHLMCGGYSWSFFLELYIKEKAAWYYTMPCVKKETPTPAPINRKLYK